MAFQISPHTSPVTKLLVREVVSVNDQARQDIAHLLEANIYGQFADDMLDHPSPSCRSLNNPNLRAVLRRHLAWLETAAT